MNILSLFDGMSCGRIALDRLGVDVDNYYSSEIDKFAVRESAANWPDNIQLGDINQWRKWDIDWSSIDLLLGGSPCQGFSMAGKKGGTKAKLGDEIIVVTTKEQYLELKEQGAEFISCSHLFWEYVLVLDHIKSVNPDVHFLLENVKMKKEYLDMITSTLGVEPILINSALVSAQNRQRWYWCNWENTQPVDKNILLKDIIEDFPKQDTLISDRQMARLDLAGERGTFGVCFQRPFVRITKAFTISARDYKGISSRQHFPVVSCGHRQLNPAAMIGRRINPLTGHRDDYNTSIPLVQYLQVKHCADKMGCLSTVAKDTLLTEIPPGRYRVSALMPKSVNEAGGYSYNGKVLYRKLTIIECCRLQTVPDHYFKVSSKSQCYKMLGNGWTVDVIAHLLIQVKKKWSTVRA